MLSRRLLWLALAVANLSTCRGQDDTDNADNVVEVEVDSVVDSDEENDAKGGTIHDLFSNEESGWTIRFINTVKSFFTEQQQRQNEAKER